MTIVYGNRGCGKTRRLIKWSAKTGGYILVSTYDRKRYVENMIGEMGLQGKAHVVTKGDLANPRFSPPIGSEISIDEVDDFIQSILQGYKVNEITTSMERKRLRGGWKYE